jgi:hypothetical protein
MDPAMKTQIELSGEELTLLATHLRQHLEQVDRELVRTDNARLQHVIAHEAKVLDAVEKRLEAALK